MRLRTVRCHTYEALLLQPEKRTARLIEADKESREYTDCHDNDGKVKPVMAQIQYMVRHG